MTSAPVFLVESERLRASALGDPVTLDGAEGHHAAVVRRVDVGEIVMLTDGQGQLARCEVVETSRSGVVGVVLDRSDVPPPAPRLTVVQALPKGDRGDLAVELMTEVGVDTVVPWSAQRCVVRWKGERGVKALRRWRSTAREAAKQSRRAWLPEVTNLAGTTNQVVDRLSRADLAVVLHEGADRPVWDVGVPPVGEVVVVVGPEGGIDHTELAAFRAAGAAEVRLGPTVLRTSTAGAVGAAVLLAQTERWRGAH